MNESYQSDLINKSDFAQIPHDAKGGENNTFFYFPLYLPAFDKQTNILQVQKKKPIKTFHMQKIITE